MPVIATCQKSGTYGHKFADGQAEANAHLIAAAPDMFDALNQAQAALEALGRDESPIYAIICRALAKATGETK